MKNKGSRIFGSTSNQLSAKAQSVASFVTIAAQMAGQIVGLSSGALTSKTTWAAPTDVQVAASNPTTFASMTEFEDLYYGADVEAKSATALAGKFSTQAGLYTQAATTASGAAAVSGAPQLATNYGNLAKSCALASERVGQSAATLQSAVTNYRVQMMQVISNAQVCLEASTVAGVADAAKSLYLSSQGGQYSQSLKGSAAGPVLDIAGSMGGYLVKGELSQINKDSGNVCSMTGLAAGASGITALLGAYQVVTGFNSLNSVNNDLSTDNGYLAQLSSQGTTAVPAFTVTAGLSNGLPPDPYAGTAPNTGVPATIDPGQQAPIQEAVKLLKIAKIADTISVAAWGGITAYCGYNWLLYERTLGSPEGGGLADKVSTLSDALETEVDLATVSQAIVVVKYTPPALSVDPLPADLSPTACPLQEEATIKAEITNLQAAAAVAEKAQAAQQQIGTLSSKVDQLTGDVSGLTQQLADSKAATTALQAKLDAQAASTGTAAADLKTQLTKSQADLVKTKAALKKAMALLKAAAPNA